MSSRSDRVTPGAAGFLILS